MNHINLSFRRDGVVKAPRFKTNKILNHNEGIHNYKQYSKARKEIIQLSELYKEPRAYHLAFVGSTHEAQRKLINKLMRELESRGFYFRYHSAKEFDANKLEHTHVFLLIDSFNKHPGSIINENPSGFICEKATQAGIKFYINSPKNPMHNGQKYARFPASKPEKVEDLIIWISYIYKSRSKESVPKTIYSKSKGEIKCNLH